MLVTYKSPLIVGIGVSQRQIHGNLRTFVILPITDSEHNYVEVECAVDENHELKIIKPSISEWKIQSDGFGDESQGYPMTPKTKDSLYYVWDDGAQQHVERSEELYTFYKYLVDYYTAGARSYLDQVTNTLYQKELAVAKSSGWDTSLVERQQIEFPYTRMPVFLSSSFVKNSQKRLLSLP